MAAAHAGPPSWLLVTLAAPHAWGLLPLLAPRAVCAVASALGYSDVPTPYTAGALVLAAAQAGAVFQWLYEWHAGQSALAREAAGGAPLLLRLVLAAPFLAGGAYLKLGAARALGRAGVGFARQLSGRVRTAPWCTAWPFSHTAHPDYAGSALMLLAAGLLLLGRDSAPPGAATVLAFWLALYATSALAEEGLACAGAPPQPALRAGCNPFWDNVSRPLNAVERVRQWLMAPVALFRSLCFWGAIIGYGLFVNVLAQYVKDNDRRRHAILVPVTRVATSTLLWICGYTVNVTGRANLVAAQRATAAQNGAFIIVCNHLSYMDILMCAAVFGPYAAVARHDLLNWPIVGPVARAWGVVGVVQSDVQEKLLAEASGKGDQAIAAPAESGPGGGRGGNNGGDGGAAAQPAPAPTAGAPPGGRAAALAARAVLPGSGWALPPVLVYPEGTTTAGGCLISFRSGAFVGGVPVLPVTLRYDTPSGFNLCWGLPHSTGGHFWRSMCAWGKRVNIDIQPLHTPTPAEAADARVFSEAVRVSMASVLGWPALSGWSIRDAHLLAYEVKHGGGPRVTAAAAAAAVVAAGGTPAAAGSAVPSGTSTTATQEKPPVPPSPSPSPGIPPLPPPSPSTAGALAARHRSSNGSGNSMMDISIVMPGSPGAALQRIPSAEGRLGKRSPSPKQA